MVIIALQNVFLKSEDLKVKMTPCSMGCRMVVNRHENNINLTVYLHQSFWVTRCIFNDLEYFESNFFSEQ